MTQTAIATDSKYLYILLFGIEDYIKLELEKMGQSKEKYIIKIYL